MSKSGDVIDLGMHVLLLLCCMGGMGTITVVLVNNDYRPVQTTIRSFLQTKNVITYQKIRIKGGLEERSEDSPPQKRRRKKFNLKDSWSRRAKSSVGLVVSVATRVYQEDPAIREGGDKKDEETAKREGESLEKMKRKRKVRI